MLSPCAPVRHTPLNPCHTLLTPPQGNREAVAPVVVQLLKEASDACPPGAPAQLAAAPGAALVQGVPAAVLRKEAAYQAVATGAYELHDYVDFTGGPALCFNKLVVHALTRVFAAGERWATDARPCMARPTS